MCQPFVSVSLLLRVISKEMINDVFRDFTLRMPSEHCLRLNIENNPDDVQKEVE